MLCRSSDCPVPLTVTMSEAPPLTVSVSPVPPTVAVMELPVSVKVLAELAESSRTDEPVPLTVTVPVDAPASVT